jgi:hypothetical protein
VHGEQLGQRLVGALARLSLESTGLHPDDVDDAIRRAVGGPGVLGVRVLVVDLDQLVLVPLGDEGEELGVDTSEGGRAYRTEETVVADTLGGGATAWIPLMDSAERIGVLEVSLEAAPSAEVIRGVTAVANFAGELIANKSSYGDSITLLRRRRALTIAAEMRWSLLPPLTFTGRNLSISGIVEPTHVIAGDTFDYAIDGDIAHIAIFDAVGHGLEAARIANLALSGYRSCRRRGLDLVESYGQVDALLLDQFGTEKFATAQLASFDLTTGRLSWINAGHPPPMVIRGGTPIDLAAPAYLPLGLADMAMDAPIETETVLEPHDRVLFFTDGVTEARSADGHELGRTRLAELACGAADRGDKPAETVRLLGHALLEHRGAELQDDATLLLLVWDGPPGDD